MRILRFVAPSTQLHHHHYVAPFDSFGTSVSAGAFASVAPFWLVLGLTLLLSCCFYYSVPLWPPSSSLVTTALPLPLMESFRIDF